MPISSAEVGIQIPEVLLPIPQVDPGKWAIIACDQFTSQPAYWQKAEALVGDSPSTLRMIYPEVYLNGSYDQKRIDNIHITMQEYLREAYLKPYQGFIYVERSSNDRVRRGLIAALDLEQYDFRPGSKSMIRATEGTIMERIPARIQVRNKAILEVPHTLVLIDDPENTVLEALTQAKHRMKPLYDLDLMLGSGHLSGWLVDQPDLEMGVIKALKRLAQPEHFTRRYAVSSDQPVMLYAVGDGNHSCAAAKVMWDNLKSQPGISPQHPARYALVEIENLQDNSLCFEPIHRVAFDVRGNLEAALCDYFQDSLEIIHLEGPGSFETMTRFVDTYSGDGQAFGVVSASGNDMVLVQKPSAHLAVGSVQSFLDWMVEQEKAARIDYVHGCEVVLELGSIMGNAGFYLPPIEKTDLFKTVIVDGALPRKTFSMGAAKDKRFYMESRRIIP